MVFDGNTVAIEVHKWYLRAVLLIIKNRDATIVVIFVVSKNQEVKLAYIECREVGYCRFDSCEQI